MYDLEIDDKNRLQVPAEVRRLIDPNRDGKAFYLVVGVYPVPWLYTESYYEDLVTQIDSESAQGEELTDYDQLNFSLSTKLEWDQQGRISFPQNIFRRSGLKKEVTLIGVRDHLEIWNRADWEAQLETLLQRSPSIALRAKKARAKTWSLKGVGHKNGSEEAERQQELRNKAH